MSMLRMFKSKYSWAKTMFSRSKTKKKYISSSFYVVYYTILCSIVKFKYIFKYTLCSKYTNVTMY